MENSGEHFEGNEDDPVAKGFSAIADKLDLIADQLARITRELNSLRNEMEVEVTLEDEDNSRNFTDRGT